GGRPGSQSRRAANVPTRRSFGQVEEAEVRSRAWCDRPTQPVAWHGSPPAYGPAWHARRPMIRSTGMHSSKLRCDVEAREGAVTTEIYEDHGVHFEYPWDWELEVTDDGPVTTVEVQAPGGLAFALVRTDESRPDPAALADEVLEAMRQEYSDLDAAPA